MSSPPVPTMNDCLHALYERLVMNHPNISRINEDYRRLHIMRDTTWSELARYTMLHADTAAVTGSNNAVIIYKNLRDGTPQSFAKLKEMLSQPLEDMPTYMGHHSLIMRAAAGWRLEIGK
ncbi:MAG: hypothetical protein GF334_02105 [Candidatus Altiarchaeales archaeon]|nr:hypothetical protein [Candidatus Altiarchaeales archaeon]